MNSSFFFFFLSCGQIALSTSERAQCLPARLVRHFGVCPGYREYILVASLMAIVSHASVTGQLLLVRLVYSS